MTLFRKLQTAVASLALAATLVASVAGAAPIALGVGGGDDCYNRVTQACNAKYPGKDWGDVHYRDCINQGLNKCDAEEPAVLSPGNGLALPGRFKAVTPMLLRR